MTTRLVISVLALIQVSLTVPNFVLAGEIVIRGNSDLDSDTKKCWSLHSYNSILECINNLCQEYQSVPDASIKRIECSKIALTLRSAFSSIEQRAKTSCSVQVTINNTEIGNPREIEKECALYISKNLPLIEKKCLETAHATSMSDINQVNTCVNNTSQQYIENFITSHKSWYIDADKRGDPDSLVLAGDNLYKSQKYDEAFKFYLRAAETGNMKAQLNTAAMYYEGKGIEKNIEEALDWYQKASDQGSWEARIKIHEIEHAE